MPHSGCCVSKWLLFGSCLEIARWKVWEHSSMLSSHLPWNRDWKWPDFISTPYLLLRFCFASWFFFGMSEGMSLYVLWQQELQGLLNFGLAWWDTLAFSTLLPKHCLALAPELIWAQLGMLYSWNYILKAENKSSSPTPSFVLGYSTFTAWF